MIFTITMQTNNEMTKLPSFIEKKSVVHKFIRGSDLAYITKGVRVSKMALIFVKITERQ